MTGIKQRDSVHESELAGSDNLQLSREDMQRVEKYLASPVHSVERKPFRPWRMMLGLVVIITLLSVLSLLISRIVL